MFSSTSHPEEWGNWRSRRRNCRTTTHTSSNHRRKEPSLLPYLSSTSSDRTQSQGTCEEPVESSRSSWDDDRGPYHEVYPQEQSGRRQTGKAAWREWQHAYRQAQQAFKITSQSNTFRVFSAVFIHQRISSTLEFTGSGEHTSHVRYAYFRF